jgi:nicotinamide phosphoribosyltransferase
LLACIQGDGINIHTLRAILEAALKKGYSAQNIAFGMGGGLLQKVNRDTMSFATKLSFIQYADGSSRDVMKLPKTDAGKTSLPGILRVVRDELGKEVVVPRESGDDSHRPNDLLRVIYDKRPLPGVWEDFQTVRDRVRTEWTNAPKLHNPISQQLQEKIANWIKTKRELLAATKQ